MNERELLERGWPKEMIKEYFKKADLSLPKNSQITLKSIAKNYGKPLLTEVSLEIKPGAIIGITGKSGSGKTTLLNIISGYLKPDQGEIQYNIGGQTKQKINEYIGYSPQEPSVYLHLTVLENLLLFASMYGINEEESYIRAKQLLKTMDLYNDEDTIASELSGGMLRRLDIACALVNNPSVLLLDEPTADLDPELRKKILHIIHKINKKGTTVVVASHFMEEIQHLCTELYDLDQGKLNPQKLTNIVKIQTRTKNYQEITEQINAESNIKAGMLVLKSNEPKLIEKAVNAAVKAKQKIIYIEGSENERTTKKIN